MIENLINYWWLTTTTDIPTNAHIIKTIQLQLLVDAKTKQTQAIHTQTASIHKAITYANHNSTPNLAL